MWVAERSQVHESRTKNGIRAADSVVENKAELIVKYATSEKEVRQVEKIDASTSQTQES
jgi:hypothetical protein